MPRLCFHAGHGHAVEPPSLSLSRLRSDNGQDSALYCIVLYFIVLYWSEAAPPAAADKGFARFKSEDERSAAILVYGEASQDPSSRVLDPFFL